MCTKKIFKLASVFMGSVIVLCCNSPAQAEINLGDGICSSQEQEMNFCITAWEYVIEAMPCENGNWPCLTADGMYKAFNYRATAPAGCSSPTWSYTVTQWEKCDGASEVDYILDADPSGSALFIPNNKISKCSEIVNDLTTHELWKLNPTLNCSDTTTYIDFTIYADPAAGISCGNPTFVRTKYGCDDGVVDDQLLRGPGCSTGAPIETTRVFDNGSATVNFDICTAQPMSVSFGNAEVEEGMAWICADGNPLTNGGDVSGCTGRVNAGPDSSGCFIHGSTNYLYGRSAYIRR